MDLELLFLGTGASSSVPHIECLTAGPNDRQCPVCLSTLEPSGRKNARRNTSALLRTKSKGGDAVTIVIDVGKTFLQAAMEWFPKHGIRKIDAILLTHPHADAMFGLDDLRSWTLGGRIQSHIDIYASQNTFQEVKRSFPYLVSKEFASGGGDVPDFKWHIIENGVPFEVLDTGIKVTPFAVHHGRVFSIVPPAGWMPTPNGTEPSTPDTKLATLPSNNHTLTPVKSENTIQPYFCLGYLIEDTICYMSDVSFIPEDVWSILDRVKNKLSVLVVDCLRLYPYTSHFGLAEAVATARRIKAYRNYMIGFTHDVSHEEWITLGEAAGGIFKDREALTENERKGMKLVGDGDSIFVRPGHDGMQVYIRDGEVTDGTYD